jgi:hypothetical protein
MPPGTVLSYVDSSRKEMIKLIDQFLTRVEQAGCRIQVPKSEIMTTSVHYLGFIIDGEQVKMDPRY